jgi:hypothetical protein
MDRLAFTNQNALKSFLDSMRNADYQTFISIIKSAEAQGFQSLMPTFTDIDESNPRFLSLVSSWETIENEQNNIDAFFNPLNSEIENEDEFIADNYFSLVLNRQRIIQIGDSVYQYTPIGLFFAHKNEEHLLPAYNIVKKRIGGGYTLQDNMLFNTQLQEASNTTYNQTIQLSSGLSFYKVDYSQNVEFADEAQMDYGDSASSNGRTTATKPLPESLYLCTTMSGTWWNKVVGPSIDCSDHFSNKRRVKTKAWNQNYLVYSSIGINVRSQKKWAGIWWANKIDELELGYSYVTFKYASVSVSFTNRTSDYYYGYKGKTYDQYGKLLTNNWENPSNIFSERPIKPDGDEVFIYFFDRSISPQDYVLLMKEQPAIFHNQMNSLAQRGINFLKSKGEKDLEKKTLAIAIVNEKDLYFINSKWKRTNSNNNNIDKSFDWRTGQIVFRNKFGDPATYHDIKFKLARSYKNAIIHAYGMGRSGDAWKGSRVGFHDIR